MIARHWPRFAAALLGFVWYLSLGGGPTLNPTNINWLLEGDWMQHWLGWLFFRHEPWTFPLGTITGLPYPIGTNIGFTDSNPLMSLLLKPFSSVLPADFQFIGPWLALCFALQGYAGAALASVVTSDRGKQILGGYLFVLSPVLVARVYHDTLCAHWLLLGLLYLGLRDYPDTTSARRAGWLAMAGTLTAAAIHPYLAVMALALALACVARLWRSRLVSPLRAVAMTTGAAAGMFLVFGMIGYFDGSQIASGGFGLYSADVLTFVNAFGFSGVLPSLKLIGQRQEGFAFLGLGGLAAVAIGLVMLLRRRPAMGAGRWFVVAACGLMAFYALSVFVTYGGHTAFKLGWLYDPIEPLTSAFRASGRFIWPLHYLLLLFGLWGLTRMAGPSRQSAATVLLALVVILQASDMRTDRLALAPKKFRQATREIVGPAAGRYRHLALYPMQVLGACGATFDDEHVYRFMLQAHRIGTTYNSGLLARLSKPRVQAECARLDEMIQAGRFDPQTIYVVSMESVPLFRQAGAACGRFDGDWICVSRESDAAFRDFVAAEGVMERIRK